DCRPVEYRQDAQHVEGEILVEGNWLPVDWKHVVTVPSPDGHAHACWWPDWVDGRSIAQIRCIILPGATELEQPPRFPRLASLALELARRATAPGSSERPGVRTLSLLGEILGDEVVLDEANICVAKALRDGAPDLHGGPDVDSVHLNGGADAQ